LLYFLGDGRNLTTRLSNKPASLGYHKFPFCLLAPWQVGAHVLLKIIYIYKQTLPHGY